MTTTTTYTKAKEILGNNGFTLNPAMDTSSNENDIFSKLYTISYDNTVILYVRENENGTFDTFELLNYPTSFSKHMGNVQLNQVMEILQSVIKINFNDDTDLLEESRTTYTWENESLEKYGKEITLSFIEQQQKHELKHIDNDCSHCGKGNEGSIIDNKGEPFLMHFGMWSYSEGTYRCNYCSKKTVSKVKSKVVKVNENVKPNKKQIEIIESMIKIYGKGESKAKTLEKLAWYDLASGIKNIELTRTIMTDLKAI